MAKIACLKEAAATERRCALLPANVKAYALLGADVIVESGLGEGIFISDDEYASAGATVLNDRAEILAQADVILSVDKLPAEDIVHAKNKTVISFLDPFNSHAYVDLLCEHQVTSFSMEMIPRSTRCQKMDALSSQASLAGYVMVT
ncbi:NAD(P)(+) transhydrogenase (Re/Si-specific) subunit alpha, partial [Pseudoalteromonas haloplanktis]|nr:NAD(P)(+) transhydrogenase (Re/Si-specific) subunit alpha [Pseudoalteromonas haloplanktis]